MPVACDAAVVAKSLALLLTPGQVTELRALNVSTPEYRRPQTVSGYFDCAHKLAQAAAAISTNAQAVYILPNPVDPALLARAANHIRAVTDRDSSTSDANIVSRRWLLVDADPVRPSGISSTDAEHEAALDRVRVIRDALAEEGWPAPLVADSGNGGHLLYRVDLPRDDGGLVKTCLEALSFRFDDNVVTVDTKVHNPARIWKLYGTPTRKGDSTLDRPHRLSRLLETPALVPVPTERLETLKTSLPRVVTPTRNRVLSAPFDLDAWIVKHGLDLLGPYAWQKGRKWLFRVCPWNADHRNQSAYLIQFPDGAIAAGCHHSSCQGNGWRELRLLYEPDAYAKRVLAKPEEPPLESYMEDEGILTPTPNGKVKKSERHFWTASELITTSFPDPRWAVPGLVAEGLTYLVGAPKIGKSFFCLSVGIAVSQGGRVLGKIQVERGEVLYLALEDGPRRLANRLATLCYTPQLGDAFHLVTEWERLGQGGMQKLSDWLEHHTACRLVLIDTLAMLRNVTEVGNKSVYLEEYNVGRQLKAVADAFRVAILVTHHIRKMSATDPMETVSGSFGLTGAADGALVIQRARGQSDATLWAMGRDLPDQKQLALQFDTTTAQWVLMGDAAEYSISKERQQILATLRDTEQAMTARDVAGILRKPQPQVKIMLWRMYQDGQIINMGDGRYAALVVTATSSNPSNRSNPSNQSNSSNPPDVEVPW